MKWKRNLRKIQPMLSKMGCVSTGLIKTASVKELKENSEAVKKENEKRRT